MTEARLQAMIIDLAKWAGYLHWHDNDSRRNLRGFPDLVLVHQRNGRLIFVEVKSDKGRLRPEQKVWGELLSKQHEFYVWHPRHWEDGVIRRVLTAETRRAAA